MDFSVLLRAVLVAALSSCVSIPALAASPGAAPAAELIARAGDRGITVAQFEAKLREARGAFLRAEVIGPALRDWLEANREDWAVTESESARMKSWLEASRRCSDPDAGAQDLPAGVVESFVARTKQQRLIYRHYGGGRVLFQQFGMEAFDATRRLIESLEAEGRLTFFDPSLRAEALEYWTRDHGAFLKDGGDEAESFPFLFEASPCPQSQAPADGKTEDD